MRAAREEGKVGMVSRRPSEKDGPCILWFSPKIVGPFTTKLSSNYRQAFAGGAYYSLTTKNARENQVSKKVLEENAADATMIKNDPDVILDAVTDSVLQKTPDRQNPFALFFVRCSDVTAQDLAPLQWEEYVAYLRKRLPGKVGSRKSNERNGGTTVADPRKNQKK